MSILHVFVGNMADGELAIFEKYNQKYQPFGASVPAGFCVGRAAYEKVTKYALSKRIMNILHIFCIL